MPVYSGKRVFGLAFTCGGYFIDVALPNIWRSSLGRCVVPRSSNAYVTRAVGLLIRTTRDRSMGVATTTVSQGVRSIVL